MPVACSRWCAVHDRRTAAAAEWGVVVSAMQSFANAQTEAIVGAVGNARDHIEADLHAEMRWSANGPCRNTGPR